MSEQSGRRRPVDPHDPLVDPASDRILTLPNAITMVRLLCLPVFVYLLFGRDHRLAAAWFLAAIAATDWIDGYLARRLQQVSTVGKILDPVADRLWFFVGIGSILIDGAVPAWFAVVVLVREGLIAIATVGLAALGARRIDVTWAGKRATFLLMFTFPMFLAAESTVGWRDTAEVLAWIAGVPGVILSYYAAAQYVPIARRALAEGRAADRAHGTTVTEVPG